METREGEDVYWIICGVGWEWYLRDGWMVNSVASFGGAAECGIEMLLEKRSAKSSWFGTSCKNSA
jgi:hypothetical protein